MTIGFYVSVRNGAQSGLLLGPYPDQPAAAANVDRAKILADQADPWAHFYDYGTARVENDPLPLGRMNQVLGLWPCVFCAIGLTHAEHVRSPLVHVGDDNQGD